MKKRSPARGSEKTVSGVARGETIGLDVGDRSSVYCILDAAGALVEEGQVSHSREALERQFGSRERARVALEAGTQSGWISRCLESWGHEVLVANGRELWGEVGRSRKNDRRDAQKLARYARLDPALLHPVQQRSEQEQLDLGAVRAREALVRARVLLVNAARGIAKIHGQRLPKTVSGTFSQRAARLLPSAVWAALALLLRQIDQLSERLEQYDELLAQVTEQRYPAAQALRAVPGVGPVTALTFVLTVFDAHRFTHSRAVGAYLGLQPKQWQSGKSDPQLGISKAGNGYLRKLLVQCAHHVLGRFGQDSALRTWGLQIAERGGARAKKRAVIAVARKLAVLLHRLWVTGVRYQPFFPAGVPGPV